MLVAGKQAVSGNKCDFKEYLLRPWGDKGVF